MLEDRLRKRVECFQKSIPRAFEHYDSMIAAPSTLEDSFQHIYPLTYTQCFMSNGQEFNNIIAEKKGSTHPQEIILVGSNENGCSIAVLLELADYFKDKVTERTIRFVCFANDSIPSLKSERMGSIIYAKDCLERGDQIKSVICIDEVRGQKVVDSLLVFANRSSLELMDQVAAPLKRNLQVTRKIVPSSFSRLRGAVQWSFWKSGYSAVMISDPTFGNEVIEDKIDYLWLAQVYRGLKSCISSISGILDNSKFHVGPELFSLQESPYTFGKSSDRTQPGE